MSGDVAAKGACGCVAALWLLLHTGIASAAPGDLGPTFGSGGIVTTAFAGNMAIASAIALQADGRIVVAGELQNGGSTRGVVARYLGNGMLDTSFGGTGFVVAPPTSAFRGIALQPDARILVLGSLNQATVSRYLPTGQLDSTFGSAGVATITTPATFLIGTAVALQPDGRIVAAGLWGSAAGGAFAARLNADGSTDVTFGVAGVARVVKGAGPASLAYDVRLQPDGRIVLAGTSDPSIPTVYRLNSDGSIDSTFGSGGLAVPPAPLSSSGFFHQAAQRPDGRIVAAGTTTAASAADIVVAQFTSSGGIDASFGTGGVAVVSLAPRDDAFALCRQSSGNIVVAGGSRSDSSGFATVVRFTPAGTLDSSFGSGGAQRLSVFGGATAQAIVCQPDSKILVAGTSTPPGGDAQFFIARLDATVVVIPSSAAAVPTLPVAALIVMAALLALIGACAMGKP